MLLRAVCRVQIKLILSDNPIIVHNNNQIIIVNNNPIIVQKVPLYVPLILQYNTLELFW